MKPSSFFSCRGAVKTILFLILGLVATCQTQLTNAPRTYFEEFDATPDLVLVKGMTKIGNLNSQIMFPVEIRAEEIRIFHTTNVLYAVAIRTALGQHHVQTDYIDYDELSGLISAVQAIKQADRSIAQLENFDVIFQTRSGLTIGKTSRENKVSIFLKSGDPAATRNVMDPYVLDSFGSYLSNAKARLDLLKQSQ